MSTDNVLIKVEGVKKHYRITSGIIDRFMPNPKMVKALNGISLAINKGETFGLVGESGCGKSTLGRIILNLESPTEGHVLFKGERIEQIKKPAEIKKMRRNMQMIFQNPSSSLNPKMTVRQILYEPFQIHFKFSKKEIDSRISDLLDMVGLNISEIDKPSTDFSDGQKQRIAIVRSLALNPEFIVADEPVSALDVSIQAQILNKLKEIKLRLNLTMLFISHDLHVVRFLSDRIGVIYLGKIVEMGPSEQFFQNHFHPYSEGLLSCMLDLTPEFDFGKLKIDTEVPVKQSEIPSGCIFQLKCREVVEKCINIEPELRELRPGQFVACHQR